MTVEEKVALQQIKTDYANVRSELTQLQKLLKGGDVEIIGKADSISLGELEATVKVLKQYKKQGFKNINL